jgi:hypothetical protein
MRDLRSPSESPSAAQAGPMATSQLTSTYFKQLAKLHALALLLLIITTNLLS